MNKHDHRNGPRTPKEHVAVRLDVGTLARIDALLPLYAIPGRAPTRSDVLRALVLAGCDIEERRAASRGPRGGDGETGKL